MRFNLYGTFLADSHIGRAYEDNEETQASVPISLYGMLSEEFVFIDKKRKWIKKKADINSIDLLCSGDRDGLK